MRSVDWRSLAKERGTSPLFVRVITAVITLTCNYSVITPPIFCCCVITRLYARVRKGKERIGGEEEQRRGKGSCRCRRRVAIAVAASASRRRRADAAPPRPIAAASRRGAGTPPREMQRYSVAVDTAHGSCLHKQKASTEDTAAGLEPATSTLNNLSA